MKRSTYRTYGIAIVLASLVVMAGCSGPFQSGSAPTETTATETMEETDTATATATPTETDSSDDQSSASESDDGVSGKMQFLVAGSDTHIDASSTSKRDGVWFNESQPHTWHAANESMTVATVLSKLGINATSDTLTYENETYDESNDGTTVAYRVEGSVLEDPENHRLADGQEVFVLVYTSDRTEPGREYSSAHPHPHGSFEATIEGEEVNFNRDQYTMNDDFFHFHGDEGGNRWHAHSTNLSASYAISSFDNFDVTNGSVTFNGTTYDENQTTVRVNGESIDPETYVMKDGDDLELVVNETG